MNSYCGFLLIAVASNCVWTVQSGKRGRQDDGDVTADAQARKAAKDHKSRRPKLSDEDLVRMFAEKQVGKVKEYFEARKREYLQAKFSESSTMRSMSELIEIRTLGEGGFGLVKKVRHRKTGEVYAVKLAKMPLSQLPPEAREEVLKEKDIMNGVDFPFIVNLRSSFTENDRLHMVLDYAENGDLQNVINMRKNISVVTMKVWAAQLALALHYLHNIGILHRDFKPMNVLLDKDFNALVADFGLSKKACWANSVCGTPTFMAPELDADFDERYGTLFKNYTKAIDWYAYGITLFRLAGGRVNMKGQRSINRVYAPFNTHDRFLEFIDGLLQENPDKRLGGDNHGFEEILKHPFFWGINWMDVLNKSMKPSYDPSKDVQVLPNFDPKAFQVDMEVEP